MHYHQFANIQPLKTAWHSKSHNRDMKTTKQNRFRRDKRNWYQWVQIGILVIGGFALIMLMTKAIRNDKGLGLVGKEVAR